MKRILQNSIGLNVILSGIILFSISIATIKAQKNVVLGILPTTNNTTLKGSLSYLTDGITFDTIPDHLVNFTVLRWMTADLVDSTQSKFVEVTLTLPTATTMYAADIFNGWYQGYNQGAANDSQISDMSLQTFDGFSWNDIPGAVIHGNTSNFVHFNFSAPVTTNEIKLHVSGLTASAGGRTKLNEIQIWSGTTALKSIYANMTLETYPNPVTNVLKVNLINPVVGNPVELLDLTGKVIKSQQIGGSKTVSIDMSNLVNGIYFCRYNDGSEIQTAKVVKQ